MVNETRGWNVDWVFAVMGPYRQMVFASLTPLLALWILHVHFGACIFFYIHVNKNKDACWNIPLNFFLHVVFLIFNINVFCCKNVCVYLGDFAPDDVEVKVREHILQDFESFLRCQVPGNAAWWNSLESKQVKFGILSFFPHLNAMRDFFCCIAELYFVHWKWCTNEQNGELQHNLLNMQLIGPVW